MKGLGWLKIMVLAVALFCAPIVMTGCGSLEKTAYTTAGITGTTVEKALLAWNDYLGQEKAKGTPVPLSDELKVKHAYERYQSAMKAVTNAGAAYARSKAQNADLPAAQAALNEAATTLGAAMSDLIDLVRGFGLKI